MKSLRFVSLLALASAALAAHADTVYGISIGTDRGIYSIDTATGASTLLYTTAHNTGGANGLAYDASTGSFYYSGDNGNLYRRNASGETLVGDLVGSAASATFHNGAYYYVNNNTNDLRQVNVGTFSDTFFGTPAGLPNAGYGDIASLADGTLYGSSSAGFYRASLATPNAAWTRLDTNSSFMQIGFSGSTLYGVSSASDRLYTINLATGARTNEVVLQNSGRLNFIDLASIGPVNSVPGPAAAVPFALMALRRRKRA